MDFLRGGRGPAYDIFHLADARDHPAWGGFFRILAAPFNSNCDVDFALRFLLAVFSAEDRLNAA